MDQTIEILDQGFSCLVEHLGIINAEQFIALIKRENFDYTVWQREYFDRMKQGEFAGSAIEYAENHPYTGKAQII